MNKPPDEGRHLEARRALVNVLVVFTSITGAAMAYSMSHLPGGALVGALAGFLVGNQIKASISPRNVDHARFPRAYVAAGFSIFSWTLLSLLWGWILGRGLLRGEGASLIFIVFILPATSFFWLFGGPAVTNLVRESGQQIASGIRPESDRIIAERCLRSSRVMSAGVLVMIAWALLA